MILVSPLLKERPRESCFNFFQDTTLYQARLRFVTPHGRCHARGVTKRLEATVAQGFIKETRQWGYYTRGSRRRAART